MVAVNIDFMHPVGLFRGDTSTAIRVFKNLDSDIKDFNIEIVNTTHSTALIFVDRKIGKNKDTIIYLGLSDDLESNENIEKDMEDLHNLGILLQKFILNKDNKICLDIRKNKDQEYVFTVTQPDLDTEETNEYIFKDMFVFYGQQRIKTTPFYNKANLRLPDINM